MDEANTLTFLTRPRLRKPYVLCGLSGSFNAGNASVGGISYLISQFKATKFAEMPAPRYHVYQVPGITTPRPVFKMEDGIIVEMTFPKNEFYYAANPASEHDLILFFGTEPSLNWEEYADNVVRLACDFGASRLCAFGGILDRSPYTREPIISCTCTSVKVRDEMRKYNVTFSNRQGAPTFNQMLLFACGKRGMDGIGLTVRAPIYPEFNVILEYSPRSVKAVLGRLNHLMQLHLNFGELERAIKELEGKLDYVRQQNLQFNMYVEELEKGYQEMPYQEPLDLSVNEAIKLAEEFLRENKGRRPGPDH